jgi:TolB-like protein/DNA-binding winged helix-turn-helix (wHTH) protein
MKKTMTANFKVGVWNVDPARCRIVADDKKIVLQPRWVDVLVLLANNAGTVVSTDDIMENVWGDVEVAQDSVYFTISHLRKALAEDDSVPTYIETIAKRGYRLVAPVTFPEIIAAKHRRIGLFGVALAAAVVLVLSNNWSSGPFVKPIPNSIAMMPFVDLEPIDEGDFALGFVDSLIIELGRIDGLEIMARTSSFSLDARKATAQEIGRQLGVSTILEGSLRRSGDSIEVTAQLIRTDNGLHIWADTYRFDVGAIERVRTDIARQVAEGLGLYLPPAYLDSLDPLDAQIVLGTRVNTYTESHQEWPRVHALIDGGYIVAWRSWDQDGSNWGIYVQRYAADGSPVDKEYRFNVTTREGQYLIEMDQRPDGGIVAAWNSWEADGTHWGVVGRLFDADAQAISREIVLNDFSSEEQLAPDVASLPDGRFAVVYQSKGQAGPGYEIYVRVFDAAGKASGPSAQVNSFAQNSQGDPHIVNIGDDRLLVIWESFGVDAFASGIAGRVLDSGGMPLRAEFRVSEFSPNDQISSAIVRLADGSAVAAWQSLGQDADGTGGWGIFGQRFDASGNKDGGEFQVNTFTEDDQRLPQITAMPDGGFFIGWMTNGQVASGMDTMGQRFDAQGEPVGAELLINVVTNSYQRNPSPAALSDGSVVVAFHADDWDGSYFGIFRRRLVFSGIETHAMIGKIGGDTFVFETTFAAVDINEFDPSIDRIDVSAFDMDYESLTFLSDDSSLIIDTGDGLIRVFGVDELKPDHFLF